MSRKTPKKFFSLAFSIFFLIACDIYHDMPKKTSMNNLTPRLRTIFQTTKTVCFGRFIVDIPESAKIVWGESNVPLGINSYPGQVDKVKESADKFIEELKSVKAIYLKNIPLLISIDETSNPKGRIIAGYEGFESIADIKINGYFEFGDDGVIIDARPLMNRKEKVIADIAGMARRLKMRTESEIIEEPGNCIENLFLPDKHEVDEGRFFEHIRLGIRLKEFSDAHLSIYLAPSNPDDPIGDSLEEQFKRIKADMTSFEERKVLESTKFFRESPRSIHDWSTGYEVLIRSPDEKGSYAHHNFQAKFIGVPHDPYKPYADIQFQTGIANDAAGATKASLTDEEALAVWDKITSSIRVRPVKATQGKIAQASSAPRRPLGELAATGRTCPQTGWWEADQAGPVESGARRYFKSGERMPHVMALGEPSLWQKLKGERPSYRSGTVWKLVSYDDAPAQPHAVAAASPAPAGAADPHGSGTAPGKPADGQNGATLPDHKG